MANTKPLVGEVAGHVAAKALCSLGADDWRRLAELGARHAAGRLSPEAYHCATIATIEPALTRAEREVDRELRGSWKK